MDLEDVIKVTTVPQSVTIKENELQWLRERVGMLESRFRHLRRYAGAQEAPEIYHLLARWHMIDTEGW